MKLIQGESCRSLLFQTPYNITLQICLCFLILRLEILVMHISILAKFFLPGLKRVNQIHHVRRALKTGKGCWSLHLSLLASFSAKERLNSASLTMVPCRNMMKPGCGLASHSFYSAAQTLHSHHGRKPQILIKYRSRKNGKIQTSDTTRIIGKLVAGYLHCLQSRRS